ncbi:flagellar biosynthesis protein FlhA [Glutamicibacter sp. ZJUTW]|uniref:flagellar biosynthesis protein FlhA n=1 Tax=Glutamicibacter sp. ZJUTW TaxID=1155384 RepID=UPI0011F13C21|nr:flagellar biosynthesis protein FlhA [Glutamicibacter sp. ZJUTW]QEP06985.1 FHIPEP family type III secretion protein [Glutamicibacter sp. ZJUTW]
MNFANLSKVAVPVGVVGIVLLLVVPVPAALLDALFATSILLSLVILLITMFAKRPLDFSVFPSLLLVATLLRLGLNVASTRLVLGQGYAGQVIEAFGQIAIGGSLVIGFVVFLILVVIQFVVVTKGAERVAEVGARFTLDAMPGKQMAIDADLNAGLITDSQARERRAEVAAEADFYGAMDGASKFVKGDAIAGLVIIIINLLGGIGIGMLSRGLGLAESLETYALLTIGDGLATQIPALLMAVSTGMIVTRSNAADDMGATASKQLGQSRAALLIAGGSAIALALIPGMPKVPFVLIGAALIWFSLRIKAREQREADAEKVAEANQQASEAAETPEQLLEKMRVHAIEVQLAADLVDVVNGGADDLLARVRALRRRVAMELGLVLPPVRTRDNVALPPASYAILVAGVEAGRGTAPRGKVLALGEQLGALPGELVHEPVFGLPGKWVPAELRHNAEMAGATTIDRVSVIVTHLSSIVRAQAPRLLSREDVRVMTDALREQSPSAVEELIPGLLSLAEVQRALQGLLAEEVAINDLPRIYEALALQAKNGTAPEALVEAAREALGPAIAAPYLEGKVLKVAMIDPVLEQGMLEALRPAEGGNQIMLDAPRLEGVLDSAKTLGAELEARAVSAVLVCAPALRPAVRRLLGQAGGFAAVLSYQEATAGGAQIETVGVIRGANALPA